MSLPTPEAISLLDRPLFAQPSATEIGRLKENLAIAESDRWAHPNDPAKIVWVGRRLGYLWRMNDAIAVFSEGISKFPDYAPLYRHRGHRYLSVRQFDRAIADFEKAAQLIHGRPDEIELDGAPNPRNIPLTTMTFNVWYHLGVAHYFKAEYESAVRAFAESMKYTRGFDDNLVAVTDWMYLSLRRLGRHEDAAALLGPIRPQMDIIENHAYHRRLLMYKGLLDPADVIDGQPTGSVDFATLGYGVGYWYLHTGQTASALRILDQVVDGPYWPAFGYIAAEVDLSRERSRARRISITRTDEKWRY